MAHKQKDTSKDYIYLFEYLGGQPSNHGIHELATPSRHSTMVAHCLVVSYTTFSPLLIVLTMSGYFLLPTPIVANSFYFQKWSVLCCPDFPLVSYRYQRQSRNTCCTGGKGNKKKRKVEYVY